MEKVSQGRRKIFCGNLSAKVFVLERVSVLGRFENLSEISDDALKFCLPKSSKER